MKKIYRLHLRATAGHTTYQDYKTKKAVVDNYWKNNGKDGWWSERIEVLRGE
jgi:hypothetical protein